jgi:glyoxylase-like metal-dependent hydrolase (beta-lactamase superfamily II)
MNIEIDAFFDPATKTVTYLVADPDTRRAAIIDSVLDYDPAAGRTATRSADAVIETARDRGVAVDYILETHVHADHLTAAPYLKRRLGGAICIGDRVGAVQAVFRDIYGLGADFPTDGSQFDRLLADGERLPLGSLEFEVMHVPGHTPACVAYRIEDAVFVGDTIFMPDFGSARCDFPGGDARTLYASVRRLLSLPPETRLFLCHDYAPGGREYRWETTVAAQRADNKHMRDGVDEDQFVAFRSNRDKELDMPALILPSVQVNIRAGHLPEADSEGRVFLKIPVNAV